MDPVTTAILAGIAANETNVGEQAIGDTYKALRKLLKNKFGKKSEVVKAIKRVEYKPKSKGRKLLLQEEIANVKADKDSEILKLAQTLLEQIEKQPGGSQFIQKATGS